MAGTDMEIVREDGVYVAHWHGRILDFDESEEELRGRIDQDLRELYNIYAREDDENLTEGAQRLKKLLLEKFGECCPRGNQGGRGQDSGGVRDTGQ